MKLFDCAWFVINNVDHCLLQRSQMGRSGPLLPSSSLGQSGALSAPRGEAGPNNANSASASPGMSRVSSLGTNAMLKSPLSAGSVTSASASALNTKS
jgi:hypothetical protein